MTELNALWAAKAAAGLKPNTVRIMRSTLRRALRDAEREGLILRNAAGLSAPARQDAGEGRSLTVDQARVLLEAAQGDRLRAAYVLAVTLGMRRGELLGLAWRDVDLDAGQLLVRQQLVFRQPPQDREGKRAGRGRLVLDTLKTGAKGRRTLDLTAEMVEALKDHRRGQAEERLAAGPAWVDSGLVFTNSIGAPQDPAAFGRAFGKMAERAGLGHWHLHEARHSAASIMLAMGTPLEVVSEVLGHSSIRITKDTYGHLLGGEKRAAAEGISAALLAPREALAVNGSQVGSHGRGRERSSGPRRGR